MRNRDSVPVVIQMLPVAGADNGRPMSRSKGGVWVIKDGHLLAQKK
jgi:hypothetical protein